MPYLHSPSEAEITAKNVVELLGNLSNSFDSEKAKWDKVLKDFQNPTGKELHFSDMSYSILKELLEEYAKTKDPAPLLAVETNLYLLCNSLDSSRIFEPPLTDKANSPLLTQLLKDIVIEPYREKMVLPFLKTYLRRKRGIALLKVHIKKIFAEKATFNDDFLNDIKSNQSLYLDREFAIQRLIATSQDSFEDALSKSGIAEIFLSKQYRFFDSMFFDWIISRKSYSTTIIEKNAERIKNCTIDEQKVISAFVIVALINRNTEESQNTISVYLEKMNISFANMESYWSVNNAELQSKYANILQEAKIALRTFFTKDFIYIVFDYLYGSHRHELDKNRLLFWLSYAKHISEFRLFVNDFEKDSIRMFLSKRKNGSFFTKSLSNFLILNRNGKPYNQPENIAMIFRLGDLIIAEFPKSGHPVQIFQSTNFKASRLFSIYYSDMDTVLYYKDKPEGRYVEPTAKFNHPGEGSIAHRGDWLSKIASILTGYGIYKDMDR